MAGPMSHMHLERRKTKPHGDLHTMGRQNRTHNYTGHGASADELCRRKAQRRHTPRDFILHGRPETTRDITLTSPPGAMLEQVPWVARRSRPSLANAGNRDRDTPGRFRHKI